MDAQFIISYNQINNYIFDHRSLIQAINIISAFIGGFSLFFNAFILWPIFNYYLIPRIEKKIGVKLMYADLYNYIPCGVGFIPPFEISFYITGRYLAWKFKGDRGLPTGQREYALKKVSYTIDKMSKKEILLSLAFVTSVSLAMIFGVITMITIALDPSLQALTN